MEGVERTNGLQFYSKRLLVAATLPEADRVLFRKNLISVILETVPVSNSLGALFTRPTGFLYFAHLIDALHSLNPIFFLNRSSLSEWVGFFQEELYFRLGLLRALQDDFRIPSLFWNVSGQDHVYRTWASWFLLGDETAKSPMISETIKRRYMDTYDWFKERDCRESMHPPK